MIVIGSDSKNLKPKLHPVATDLPLACNHSLLKDITYLRRWRWPLDFNIKRRNKFEYIAKVRSAYLSNVTNTTFTSPVGEEAMIRIMAV